MCKYQFSDLLTFLGASTFLDSSGRVGFAMVWNT